MKQQTLRLTKEEDMRLRRIAQDLGYFYDGKPSISKVVKAIANKELVVYKKID